ncbi:uncharacterized protein BYT42DRAFT_563245 [Radiomyces spectabilis]|uniref:uncharacterized protein n=1 Tax=Radiomyces spectabilis TaxID=64574 RepID=UPI00222067E5|nr:uncharacterized protein BYT42DRAFT_563245 [Radiomyces spectabilis]KAI8384664.1 hypothetical protein BYT42DRAFT_563245 [Radiomyces spectabilis]
MTEKYGRHNIQSLRGQIRHRRKLFKTLFFIDLQPEDEDDPKVQVLFRSDDGSIDDWTFQESYRACRPGNRIQLEVGTPNDPMETVQKPYAVFQCNSLPQVLHVYDNPKGKHFISDPPLASNQPKDTVRTSTGSLKEKSTLVCKFWINQRHCLQQDLCPFQHPTGDDFLRARELWVEERLATRRKLTEDVNDPHKSKKPHAMRAMIFAEWIFHTFAPILPRGFEALDIAGGKGELAMFMSRGYGIPTTVVEPNERKRPPYWYTRLLRLMLVHISKNGVIDERQGWPCDVEPQYLPSMLDDELLNRETALLDKVALLVGLHADQATEPIVDAALSLGKPFAVVPCCVFSHQFRSRRLQSGKPVTTTEDLIQYLCEKDTNGRGTIRKTYLDFEGKNVVVYWYPEK